MKNNISNLPPIGTVDWTGDEFRIRKYIFDTWRKVCERYGYEEYLTPILEKAEIYRAKSGEDIGGKELLVFQDRAGRELALRPEMTPSVTRLVSRIYDMNQKPLKLFSIANFFRNERPQRGRNREFWQLNFDIFGSQSIWSDIEVLQMALDLMLAFDPPKGSFVLQLNNRKLLDAFLESVLEISPEMKIQVVRIMDKREKMDEVRFENILKESGLASGQIENVRRFMASKNVEDLEATIPQLAGNAGLNELRQIIQTLSDMGYSEWIAFKPSVIRGFDYYDGMIFEVFDTNPLNNRAMFGGGRYNGLAGIFGVKPFPAVGSAPGDETMKLFLQEWKILDSIIQSVKAENYYIPILDEALFFDVQNIAKTLRKEGGRIETGLKVQNLGKALEYANQKKISKMVILGENEKKEGIYKIKDMMTGAEQKIQF